MASVELKDFDSPDEVRPFEGKGRADIVNIGGRVVGRGVFEPGWRWSDNVKPMRRPIPARSRIWATASRGG